MSRAMGETRTRLAASVVLAAWVLVCWGMGARTARAQEGPVDDASPAQEGSVDSTVAQVEEEEILEGQPGLSDLARDAGDSTRIAPASASALSDSILALIEQMKGLRWLDFAGSSPKDRPSVKGSYNSSKASYGPGLDLDLPLFVLGGFRTVTHYHLDSSREPTTNQEKKNRSFSSNWNRTMGEWGRFNMALATHHNRTTREGFEPSSSDDTKLDSQLSGGGTLGPSNFSGKWSIQGGVNKKKVISGSRSGATDQTMNNGVFSGALGRRFGPFGLSMSAGLNTAAGPQKLSAAVDGSDAQEATKTTISDTLGVALQWHGLGDRNFSVSMSRQAFNEKRLDYETDYRGVAIFDPETNQKIVGHEKETRNITSIQLAADTRIFRSIRTRLSYGIDKKETQYTLSQEGFVPEQGQSFKGDLFFRYARAGSLKVSLGLNERWDDRRPPDTGELRGRHYTVSDNISFTMDQYLLGATSLRLIYAQDLAQQIYDYKLATGTSNTDVLSNRYESRLSSKAIDRVNVTLAASYKTSSNIFLDALQVANNNRDLDTWKVTGDYKWTMTPAVSFGQSYQLSIDYTDYHYSYVPEINRRDKFYKRTQMKTDLDITLPGAVGFSVSHVVDRTRGGTKEMVGGVESLSYTDDVSRRQDEQRLQLGLHIPVFGYTASVQTSHVYRLLRGQSEETQGDLRIGLKGQSKFLHERLVLGLDLGYVWAFGPPRVIRIDRDRRYFTSSSYVSWSF